MHRDNRRPIVDFLERRLLMSSTLTYNRAAAVAYANQYWDEVVTDGYFWINGSTANYYGAGSPVPVNAANEDGGIGDDCAHFVSSCIGSPGGGLNIPSRAGTYGEPGAARLDELLVGNSAGGYGTTYEYGELVSSVSQLQPGDVIGYVWGTTSGTMDEIDHTVIYMGNGLIDAHAASHSDLAWNSLDSVFTAFFIHITVPSTTTPSTPTNTLPANNAVVTTTTPTLTASAFSESGATQSAAEWQILEGGTLVYDSGANTSAKTSLTVASGILSNDTTYTWDVRYEDNSGNWSSYSTATSFTITIGPNTPVNSSPANNATVFNPVILSASAFSDSQSGATQIAAEWIVDNSSSKTVFVLTDSTDLTSVTVPSADLTTGQTYSWQVRYEDNNGYWSNFSAATSFNMGMPSTLTLPTASAYYLQDSANGQSLNVWNSTSDSGTPNQILPLAQITTIIIDGSSNGSNIIIDFANGSPSPANRLTVFGSGSASQNTLSILGSTSGNDTVSLVSGNLFVNGTEIVSNGVGNTTFTPGGGTDSLSVSDGTLYLGDPQSGAVNLSSLSVSAGASLDIGSDILYLGYTGASPESTIGSLIESAYNNGLWNGAGITSSLVAANPQVSAIADYDNGSQIKIRATWKGDANADGVLNADDLSLMALEQAQGKTNWAAGNFNYDSQVNADDWLIFNYAVAYANGRNYSNVFSPGVALGSSAQMSQLLVTPTM